jgi:PAS domain S-box-containing protein
MVSVDQDSIFRNAPFAYFILDRTGSILDANQSAEALLQTERANLLQKPLVAFVPQEYHNTFYDHLNRCFEADEHGGAHVQIRRPDGSLRHCRLESQVPVEGDSSCVAALLDLTDHFRIEDELTLTRDTALRTKSAMSRYLADMSNEIRAPMDGILAIAERALSADITDEQRTYFAAVDSTIRSFLSIIDEVLDFARIEDGTLVLERKPFALAPMLESARNLFGRLAHGKPISLELHVPDGTGADYTGDPRRIGQILSSLLRGTIEVLDSGLVTIAVRENRGGIDPVELVFEIGSTRSSEAAASNAPRDHRIPAIGPALTFSHKLTKLMGGRLSSRRISKTEHHLTLSLPVGHAKEPVELKDGLETTKDAPHLPVRDGEHPRIRVLVADDNELNSLILQTVLRKADYEVTIARTGREVVTALQNGKYNLVLMDISMPDMDGIETTRAIRAGAVPGEMKDIPIVAITAYSEDADRASFLSAGMNDYLSKPFRQEDVLTKIARVLDSTGETHQIQ